MKQIKDVVEEKRGVILKKANVVGIGEGEKNGKPCVVVLVEQKLPLSELKSIDVVPTSINNHPTDVIEVGKLKALSTSPSERQKIWNPAPGGVSIGHYRVGAGTFGCVVKATDGTRYILSNNHVLANCNEAEIGDRILQPGIIEGSTYKIGHLKDFKRIVYDGEAPPSDSDRNCKFAKSAKSIMKLLAIPFNLIAKLCKSKYRIEVGLSKTEKYKPSAVFNTVDCAIAIPVKDEYISDEILDTPKIDGVMDAYVGLSVSKSGRTTGLTHGKVVATGATVQINFGVDTATFEGQIVANYMCEAGDSGSLVWSGNKAVGLLFAGSAISTIMNPIQKVLDTFNVTI